MSSRETAPRTPPRASTKSVPLRRALLLATGAVALAMSAGALAQQKPLTGQMLDGRTSTPAPAPVPASAPTTETEAAPTPAPPADNTREPATTYPTASAHPARTAAASKPAQAPMPDYTNMKTAYIQPPPTTDEERSLPFGTPIGGVAHYLLRMQASNQHAVDTFPTLGDEASAAYRRYLQSFNHPIPDFFKTMVKSDSGSSQ